MLNGALCASVGAETDATGAQSLRDGPLVGVRLGQTLCADATRALVAEDKLSGVRLDPLTGGFLAEFMAGAMDASRERGGHFICDGGGGTVQAIALQLDPASTLDVVQSLRETETERSSDLGPSGVGRAEFDTSNIGAARVLVSRGEAGTDSQLIYRSEACITRVEFLAANPEARASVAGQLNPGSAAPRP